jgi:hypothetical protein
LGIALREEVSWHCETRHQTRQTTDIPGTSVAFRSLACPVRHQPW